MKQRTGSALVITLLMISILSTVSFSITALAISEFRKSSAIQDSVAAYYAAESGLEHGLLQNRLWRDAELSKEVYDYVRTTEVTSIPQDKVPTKDLKTGTPASFRVGGSLPPGYINSGEENGSSWYDLKVYYRGPEIGKVENGVPKVDPDKSPRIYRDSALDINVKGASELRIAWEPDPVAVVEARKSPLPPRNIYYFVEVMLTANSKTMNSSCQKPVGRELLIVDAASGEKSRRIPFKGCNYETARIKPWNMSYMQYSIALVDDRGEHVKLDNTLTFIQATGGSGKAKRTLEVALPRSNKTILEAEDFLFISADEKLSF